ncbi:hypothetical protein ACIRYZ_37950 [Kitasatospora sp. NPDC101155]|uniref:hypothetical protein n=1 Tax=Kitasatospora sp. NPDC101155 TaxID=3364097 RepID=UPI0037F5B85A
MVRDDNKDGWREYDDSVPVIATTLELLAEHGPLGPVRWRYGRPGRHSLTEGVLLEVSWRVGPTGQRTGKSGTPGDS